MLRISLLIACVMFACAGSTAWYIASMSVRYFEQETQKELQIGLEAAGQNWVRLEPNGLELRVSGVAKDETARFRALEILAERIDSARIIDNMTILSETQLEPPRFTLEILRSAERVSLIGLVPDHETREALLSKISTIDRKITITDMLETARHPASEEWESSLDYGIESLALLERAKVSIVENRVVITAVTDSEDSQSRIKTRLARRKPDHLELEMKISAPRSVIAPFRFRMTLDEEGPNLVSCSADREATRDKILAAVDATGASGRNQCDIGLGVPTPDWADAVIVGIEALSELGTGSLSFTDTEVAIIASSEVDDARFVAAMGRLDRRLPDFFTLTSILTPKPQNQDEERQSPQPEIKARLSLEGDVIISGRVNSNGVKSSINAVAQSYFGSDHVAVETVIDEELPVDWPVRVMVGLEALSFLKEGEIRIGRDKISVEGRSIKENAASEVGRVLSSSLGGRGNYGIDIVYDETLLPVPDTISDEVCEAKIGEILDQTGFKFEPGSVTMTDEGLSIVSKIARVLALCPETEFEIQGHTDSQGPWDLNLGLSQARADAVLGALLGEEILVKGLTSRGYGESQPVADNATETGRDTNRRISFVLSKNVDPSLVIEGELNENTTKKDNNG